MRVTADNPFIDPDLVAAQIDLATSDRFDYVGAAGWPLGTGAEVASGMALETAVREATDPAEREHVMPFIYNRPERFRIGSVAAEFRTFLEGVRARKRAAFGTAALDRVPSGN